MTDLDRIDNRFQLLSFNSFVGSTNNQTPDPIRSKSVDYSPPINTIRFDFGDYPSKYEEINDVLRVAPEDLATQLTLIDLTIFVAIQPQELTSCQWNRSKKNQFSPNVVAFTQRFNRVSFWVVQEILSQSSIKHRAEVLSHFIKVAKRLLELNNLHSAFAIKSALTSAPIHRLSKTWGHLSKKDKLSFERLSELFSDTNNFERLRDHLNGAKTPCIPYLGLYLHDITYIDVLHPQTRGLEDPQRKHKMDAILRIISEFQRSVYDTLPIMPNVQEYLLSVRYIEELQKFLEDENYKLSLKLEPPESDKQSVFYVRENSQTFRSLNESSSQYSGNGIPTSASFSRLSVSFTNADTTNANSMLGYSRKKFTAGHRKANSLGTNVLSSIQAIPSSSKSLSTKQIVVQNCKNRCLIDDSLINDEPIHKPVDALLPSLPKFDIIYDIEETNDPKEEQKPLKRCFTDNSLSLNDKKVIFQGIVKRKTVLRDGKKPSVAKFNGWVRFWLVLQESYLLFFDSKHYKNYGTNFHRSNPLKCRSLRGWCVALVEDSQTADTFTLSDSLGKNVYKFQAPTAAQAFEWYIRINQVLSEFKTCPPKTTQECLIDFGDDSNKSNKNRLQFPNT